MLTIVQSVCSRELQVQRWSDVNMETIIYTAAAAVDTGRKHLYNYCMKYQIKFVPNANFLRVACVHLTREWGETEIYTALFMDFEGGRIKIKCTVQTSSVETAYT